MNRPSLCAAALTVCFVAVACSGSSDDAAGAAQAAADARDSAASVKRHAPLAAERVGDVALPLHSTKSFQVTTANFTDRFMRHQNGLGFTSVVNGNSAAVDKQDATFKVVRGLASADCYSLRSVNFPNDYLRHANDRLRKDAFDDTEQYKRDATWCARPGLSGKGVSFESLNFPGHYPVGTPGASSQATGALLLGEVALLDAGGESSP
jgi:Alpha-L-arabinofuranosidase B (ABFB) domain